MSNHWSTTNSLLFGTCDFIGALLVLSPSMLFPIASGRCRGRRVAGAKSGLLVFGGSILMSIHTCKNKIERTVTFYFSFKVYCCTKRLTYKLTLQKLQFLAFSTQFWHQTYRVLPQNTYYKLFVA